MGKSRFNSCFHVIISWYSASTSENRPGLKRACPETHLPGSTDEFLVLPGVEFQMQLVHGRTRPMYCVTEQFPDLGFEAHFEARALIYCLRGLVIAQ